MWENIIEMAATNGLWALLFVVLLWYLLQDSRKRETKYQQTIQALTERLEIVVDIKEKIEEITPKRRMKSTKSDKEGAV